jgi:hypothetical protein
MDIKVSRGESKVLVVEALFFLVETPVKSLSYHLSVVRMGFVPEYLEENQGKYCIFL